MRRRAGAPNTSDRTGQPDDLDFVLTHVDDVDAVFRFDGEELYRVSHDHDRPRAGLQLYYHGGIGVVRTLGRLGVPVYAIHPDRASRPPLALRAGVVKWIGRRLARGSLELVLRTGRRLGEGTVLIAADDTAQEFVSHHADALASVFRFPRQPRGLTQQLYSKRGLHELCREHGVPSPATEFPQTAEEARAMIERSPFPVILKPVEKMRFQRRNGIAITSRRIASTHSTRTSASKTPRLRT